MNAATKTAQAAAGALFALPTGTQVKLTLQNKRVWEGEITKMGTQGCDLLGKRGACRSIVRNVNTGVGFFIEIHNSSAVMAVEVQE